MAAVRVALGRHGGAALLKSAMIVAMLSLLVSRH
jgi:hypothetical protein